MPEGPEIYLLKKQVLSKFKNTKLINIISNTKAKLTLPSESKLISIETYGKQMIMIFEDYKLAVHMGLTGWINFEKDKKDLEEEHNFFPKYEFEFKKNNKIIKFYVNDKRRFSKLKFIKTEKEYNNIINNLGEDILTNNFNLDIFKEKIKLKNTNISSILLDQHIFSGIGNYIRNEALYKAKISPYKYPSELSDEKIIDLFNAIIYVAYSSLYSSLKEYGYSIPKIFNNKSYTKKFKFNVYERDLDLKGNRITQSIISGRKSYYVKSIQK
jgi:formamidopyrimidine-DNA glycosylase